MRPGLANAFLVGFIESIADFGNPIVLGGDYGVLSTEIYFAVVGAQLDYGRAAALALLLLAFALGAFFLQRRIVGTRSYATISGKGDAGLPTPLPDRGAPRRAMDRAAVGGLHLRALRLRLRRRAGEGVGPRLHADARPLRQGLRHRAHRRRPDLVGRGLELVLDDGEARRDRRPPHRRARPDRGLAAGAPALRRPRARSNSRPCCPSPCPAR